MELTRREFLGEAAWGVGVFCFGPTLAWATGERPPRAGERILVVLQLSGGNDGLSTVIPYADDAYGRARRRTRIPAAEVLRLNRHVGFHPNLKALKALYDEGQVAVVQGVGYPNPNRSHFKSMDIWHAADHRGRALRHGWIGRLVDTAFRDVRDPTLVIHVGPRIPFSLQAGLHRPIAFTAPNAYRWVGLEEEWEVLAAAAPTCEEPAGGKPGRSATARDLTLRELRRLLHEARTSSEAIRRAVAAYRPQAAYPRSALGAYLATVAALVSGGLTTRIYSIEFGGFDTHVNQKGRHDNLMRQVGEALAAFHADLAARGLERRVLVMAFSEFGRRVQENGSGGTDHGTAGPMLLVGGQVRGGLHGRYPSLTRLDRGDLIHTVDFRQVYATVIEDWLGCPSRPVLGKTWRRLPLIAESV